MKTTAIALTKFGEASSVFAEISVDLPTLRPSQVLVEAEAFGLNYAEVMARRGLYGDTPPLPAILGYESVGRVVEVGSGVDPVLVGKRVIAFCRFGGYAKHVITESTAIAEIGDYDSGKALALATQYVTAFYMVERTANVQKDEIVLVHAAAGGVGTALIQLCKQKGAIVIAKVSSRDKEKAAKDLGADFTVNYKEFDYENKIVELLDGRKVDVAFNPVGGITVKKDLRSLGSGGRLVLFGGSDLGKAKFGIFSKLNFVRKMGFFTPIVFMMRSKSVCGVNMLRIADDKPLVLQDCLNAVVSKAKRNEISPQVGRVYDWNELRLAHDDMESGKTTGKLVIKC